MRYNTRDFGGSLVELTVDRNALNGIHDRATRDWGWLERLQGTDTHNSCGHIRRLHWSPDTSTEMVKIGEALQHFDTNSLPKSTDVGTNIFARKDEPVWITTISWWLGLEHPPRSPAGQSSPRERGTRKIEVEKVFDSLSTSRSSSVI